jgi:abortive infection bacteriophage resistance protein
LRIPAKLPKKTANKWLAARTIPNRKVYIVLAIIVYLLDTITPRHTFRQKIVELTAKYPNIDIAAMGFPHDWPADPFWA